MSNSGTTEQDDIQKLKFIRHTWRNCISQGNTYIVLIPATFSIASYLAAVILGAAANP